MSILRASAPRQTLVFWGAIAILGAASLISFFSTQRLVALMAGVEHTQNVLVEINRFVSNLKDVETGARGYVITHERRYLQPYQYGRRNFDQSAARLRELAAPDPALRERLERLEALARERIRIASQVAAAGDRSDANRAVLPAITAGKALMDRIRVDADGLIAAQQGLYRAREREVARQVWITSLAMLLAAAIAVAGVVWLFVLRNREFARRARAEEELRTLNAELEERVQAQTADVRRSRELLNTIIENIPDTIFLKDVKDDCRYLLINQAGEKLLGRERAELVGRVDHELFPRAEAHLCQKEDLEIVATGTARMTAERPITTGSGRRLVESRKVPVADTDGEQRFVLGIVRDVTDQKATEDQLRQLQRMDALGRLTGGIAHDFNNLLAIILGSAEMLRERVEGDSEMTEIADEAIGAVSHGAELVQRMLAFARMQHLEPTVVDLNERLPALTALLRRTLGERIAIRVQPAPDLWKAMVDPTQIDDALVNLSINSRDAMPEGGSLTIETGNAVLDEDYVAHHSEVSPGEYVMLAVSDTGTGMSPEVIARAFEPFFTTKPPGEGTGLGLSQVYGWVKQSGGHIKIYSERGHGTTIKLYLPRAAADAAAAPTADDGPAASSNGNETILVVEDNPNVRRTLIRQLSDLGYASIEAEHGAQALEIVRTGAEFDLLLTDVVMPGGISGYDLAESVRELRPAQKILFTSGYTELAAGGGRADRGPLLSKPYRKQELGRAIRLVLDNGH